MNDGNDNNNPNPLFLSMLENIFVGNPLLDLSSSPSGLLASNANLTGNELSGFMSGLENFLDSPIFHNGIVHYNNSGSGSHNNFNLIEDTTDTFLEDVKIVLPNEDIEKLKTHTYAYHSKHNTSCPNTECNICLDEYIQEDVVKYLPCNHIFHPMCIDQWLSTSSNKCPVCRAVVGDGTPLI